MLFILSLYAPFFGFRILRMAGDEKVYVAQALEMAQKGHWFFQTLFQEPNYYKGPLHYILLRIGTFLFGFSNLATLYMNLVWLCLAGFMLSCFIQKKFPHWKQGDLFIPFTFAGSLGIYAHTWASQMECGLACLFACAFICLEKTPLNHSGWHFWLITGITAWMKSPLHSVFLTCTAFLFWFSQHELFLRLKQKKCWQGLLWGISVGIAGFLPSLIGDFDAFYTTYLYRETLAKTGSCQGPSVALFSTFGFYLLPWMFLAWSAVIVAIRHYKKSMPSQKRLVMLCICSIAPSVLFFIFHPYRFENYNLPVISAIWIFIATVYGHSLSLRQKTTLPFQLAALYPFLIALCGIIFWVHFHPLPEWVSTPSLLWLILSLLLSTLLFFFSDFSHPYRLMIAQVALIWGITPFLIALGEFELKDFKNFCTQQKISHVSYYNLDRNIWNEWAYLQYWENIPITVITNEAMLRASINNKTPLIIAPKDQSAIMDLMKEKNLLFLRITPWKRLRTRGTDPFGNPLWKTAWKNKDLTLLIQSFWIMTF